jgi:hypothetical protein
MSISHLSKVIEVAEQSYKNMNQTVYDMAKKAQSPSPHLASAHMESIAGQETSR